MIRPHLLHLFEFVANSYAIDLFLLCINQQQTLLLHYLDAVFDKQICAVIVFLVEL
jgi:hypothetical protein